MCGLTFITRKKKTLQVPIGKTVGIFKSLYFEKNGAVNNPARFSLILSTPDQYNALSRYNKQLLAIKDLGYP